MKKITYLFGMILLLLSTTGCLKENTNPAEGTPVPMAALITVKDVFRGDDVNLGPDNLNGAHLTTGVVVSDATSRNFPEGYVIIQNSWRNRIRGIALVVDPSIAQKYSVGDSLVIDVRGTRLKEDNGTLTLQNIKESQIQLVSSNNPIIVQSVSLDNLSKNFKTFESTVVSTTADLSIYPAVGETIAGEKSISDGSAVEDPVVVFTESSAVFSSERIAPSATFRGIAYMTNDSKQIRLRSIEDMMFPSGSIYAGFPETFELAPASSKGSYNMAAINNNIDLATGNWKLFQAILGETANRDRIVSGKQAIRFQQNLTVPALLQMNFDVPDGATKVTVWYGAYYTDASSTFVLEASQDGGHTWTRIGEPISDAHKTSESLNAKQATFMMDIEGPVRFRINKLGLGPSSGTTVQNGRLGMDDFAIYKNY